MFVKKYKIIRQINMELAILLYKTSIVKAFWQVFSMFKIFHLFDVFQIKCAIKSPMLS